MSSFFTAFVFWAILKWESLDDEKDQNKWIILIAYMMGLSIGVHLLNLVTIPALALIIYFKKFKEVTFRGVVISLFLGLISVGLIVEGIIPGIPTLANTIEIIFVNNLGLPFGSGIILFSIVFLLSLIHI